MITLKEKKMLLKMKAAMGEPTEELQAEVNAEEQKLNEQSESRKAAFNNIFADLSKNLNELAIQDKKRSTEQQALVEQLGNMFNNIARDPQVPEEIREELVKVETEPAAEPEPSVIDRVVAHVKETTAPSMFVQPDPPTTGRDIQAIQSKLKLLEGWVSKIAMTGPGGGEVLFRYLDDVNRNTMTAANDNWVLEYDAATKKVQFTDEIGPIQIVNYDPAHNAATHSHLVGATCWNNVDKTLNVFHPGGVIQQVGQEQYYLIKNTTGNTITNGMAVMFAGAADSNGEARILGAPFLADGTYPNLYVMGIATQDILNNEEGFVTSFGKVRDLDTTGTGVGETWAVGDILYANPASPGELTNVKPTSPDNVNPMAAVLKVSATVGEIFVRPTFEQKQAYGQFSDTTDQAPLEINTPYAITFNTTIVARGFHVNGNTTPTSTVTCEYSGRYTIYADISLTSTNSSAKAFYVWLRKNGTDVPNSARRQSVSGNDTYQNLAYSLTLSLDVDDTFEVMYAADDITVSINSPTATAFCPAIPSITLLITQVAL